MTDATLDSEDNKLVVLARSSRARNGSAEGAAVRDEIGRTYTASEVNLPSLRLSAVQVAVAMAASSGARTLEAAALVTEADGPSEADLLAVRDMSAGVLFVAAPDGTVKGRHR
ncbi:cytidine deaminase [Thermopolyspora sp. NPDC052614]|uniref:cytidine deaminase n=1 Tax=Thermopolyspora sp. NPDC052614 TaxID=3155682 RepID=UPI0034198ACF